MTSVANFCSHISVANFCSPKPEKGKGKALAVEKGIEKGKEIAIGIAIGIEIGEAVA